MPSIVNMGSNREEINVLNASNRKEIKTSTPHIFNMSWNPNSTWKQRKLPWCRYGCTLKERFVRSVCNVTIPKETFHG